MVMKKFHSQQSNQIFKLNNAKVRLVLKAQNEGEAKPEDQASSHHLSKQQKHSGRQRGEDKLLTRQSSKNLINDAFKQNPMAFSSQEAEMKDSQSQSRVNLKGSISQYTRK